MRRSRSAVAGLVLLLGVAVCVAEPASEPGGWLPYVVSGQLPRNVKPEAFDKIRSGMTLGQVVERLGKGWIPPFSGTGVIAWGCTDGRDLKVKPRRYAKDEAVSFEPNDGNAARMWIEPNRPKPSR